MDARKIQKYEGRGVRRTRGGGVKLNKLSKVCCNYHSKMKQKAIFGVHERNMWRLMLLEFTVI